MSKFNPGDICILISAKCEQNVGKVVTVVEDLGVIEEIEWEGVNYKAPKPMHVVIIECDSMLRTSISAQISGAKPNLHRGPVPSWRLMPLRGDFAPERQKSQEFPA